MNFETLKTELKNFQLSVEDSIALVKVDRPKALNALNSETLTELDVIITECENSDEVKGIIITGEGKAFVAGADISQMRDFNSYESRSYMELGQSVFYKIENLSKPVIAAVNGFSLGGGMELAMACDIRIASEKAVFGQPEVTLGIIPGFGGTQRLTRLVGIGKAKELLFTGRIIKSDEAKELGIVNKIVTPEELLNEAISMMKTIIANAPIAVQYAKLAVNKSCDVDLLTGLEIEKNLISITFSTEDQKEGMSAFLEKRKAEFKNK